ncbi:MAG: DUF1800 domain-containing protein [Chloroflexi bacterium]|nr:DUF1800 domain-containing protein [Chloroflexota bacterium]MYD49530.1 DUF1800 domain-containing protein [Chloroflexota bacterium]
MSNADIALMAHLMRRAGFGASRDELEQRNARGYENVVEDLLNPGAANSMPDDVIRRYHVDMAEMRELNSAGAYWLYRMVTTDNPLEEKMALFWHSLFATGYSKLNQARALMNQIDTSRRNAMGDFRTMLVELSKDPAMIIWLDNNDNHKGDINENYGRELLELFSMGIGNYTEDDVKECARAFTGWTLGNAEYMATRASRDSIWPYSRISWHFQYRDHDHDDGEKTFLGETGNFNGEDIIDIIVRQEATARFICTRLFQFFAADEVDAAGEAVIEEMMASYFASGYEIRSVLRTLFNSDYFKSESARFARVKGPVELVVGAVRLAGTYQEPTFGADQLARYTMYMGQGIFQPPSVEGWHEGAEWIDSGALVERVNFVGKELGDPTNPGVMAIIDRASAGVDGPLSAEAQVDVCADLLGPIPLSDSTRSSLSEFASQQGEADLRPGARTEADEQRIANLLRLLTATREYQLA